MGFDGFEEGNATTSLGKIFYIHKNGSAPAIIMLHGVGASLRTWSKMSELLPKNEIYMLDFLGHGKSDAPEINYDVMTQVSVLGEFINNLSIDAPILFGHSYGAWVAILYSLKSPTKALIIEDSAGLAWQVELLSRQGILPKYRDDLIAGSIKIGANEQVIRSIVSNSDKNLLTKGILSGLKEKVLVIWGSKDDLVELELGIEMADSIPNRRLVIIYGAGHVPHITNPEAVADELYDFLSSL